MADGPGVLLLVLPGFRVQKDVVHPAAVFVSGEQVVTVEVAGGVHTEAWFAATELGVVVGNGDAIRVDDEDVPLAVDAVDGVVVVDSRLASVALVAFDGLRTKALV